MVSGRGPGRLAVVELGAGLAVPTVRFHCERTEGELVRINPVIRKCRLVRSPYRLALDALTRITARKYGKKRDAFIFLQKGRIFSNRENKCVPFFPINPESATIDRKLAERRPWKMVRWQKSAATGPGGTCRAADAQWLQNWRCRRSPPPRWSRSVMQNSLPSRCTEILSWRRSSSGRNFARNESSCL